jgi:hypothetical protein
VHSLHVRDQISLEIAGEGAAVFGTGILRGIMDATVLGQLVSGVEGLFADVTVEGGAGLDAEMRRFMLAEEEVEVETLFAVVAAVFGFG